MNDDQYRRCVDKDKGNCQYTVINQYGIACCSIDHISQVESYGCTPADILKRRQSE